MASFIENTVNNLKASYSSKIASAISIKPVTQLALRDIKNLNRPAPSWRWNLIMPPLPGVIAEKITPKVSFLSSISSLISKDPLSPQVVCESVELPPLINLGSQQRFYEGHMVTYPGLPSYENVTAVFYESEDYATLNYFHRWQKYVYNPDTRVYGVPGDYGWTVEFIGFPITDYGDVKRYISITMKTCWPVTVQKLNYGNTTDRIRIQAELSYHDMEIKIVGGASTGSSSLSDLGSAVNNLLKWRS